MRRRAPQEPVCALCRAVTRKYRTASTPLAHELAFTSHRHNPTPVLDWQKQVDNARPKAAAGGRGQQGRAMDGPAKRILILFDINGAQPAAEPAGRRRLTSRYRAALRMDVDAACFSAAPPPSVSLPPSAPRAPTPTSPPPPTHDTALPPANHILPPHPPAGVLTDHTPPNSKGRRSHVLRPHLEELLRLLPHFEVGLYSSATPPNVRRAMGLMEDKVEELAVAKGLPGVWGRGPGRGGGGADGGACSMQRVGGWRPVVPPGVAL